METGDRGCKPQLWDIIKALQGDGSKEEDDPDLTVRGSVGNPLLVRRASFAGNGRFRLEGYGTFVAELQGDDVRYNLQGFGKKKDGATRTDFVAGRVE